MTRQTTEALIAESREVARQYDPTFRFVLERVIDRLEAVAEDSSEGQYQHAHWQQRAEEAERERDSAMASYEDYLRIRHERDTLAAVIEKVREQVEHTMHPERYKARCGVCRLDTILTAAPDDVLREHDAKVRAEALRDPGDAEVEAAAEAMREQSPANTPIWGDWVWVRFARAALIAAQAVHRG